MKKLFFSLSLFLFCFFGHAQNVGLDWAYSVGGTGWDFGQSIKVGPSGNIYATGLFEGTIDIDPGPGTWNLTTNSGFSEFYVKKVDPTGNLLWAHQIATGAFSDSITGKVLDVDASGNMYLTGKFSGTVDFDPGLNTFNLTVPPGFSSDIFILKLDAAGNFLWATRTGGSNYEQVSSISVDPSGNVFCSGSFYGTVDFDPGAGTADLTASRSDIFIQKLDPSGNFLWVKNLGNNNYNIVLDAVTDNQGSIILSGIFNGTMDFDPGSATFNLTSTNNIADLFTVKLDAAGDFLWASYIATASSEYRGQTNVDDAGNVYVAGAFNGTANFNLGTSPTILNSSNNGSFSDGFIQKLSPQGTFLWVRQFGTSSVNFAYMDAGNLETDASGNAYLTGFFQGEIDFDPGPGIDVLPVPSQGGNFVIKMNSTGDYVWGKSLASSNYMLISDLSFDPNDNIYMTGGFFQPLDFDPSPGTFTLTSTSQSSDIFVLRWSQDSCSNLAAVIDSTLDVSCTSPGFASGYALGGLSPYTYEWNTTPVSTDTFASFTEGGMYEFTVTDSKGCTRTSNFLIGGPTNPTGQDLVVNMTSTRFRSGFPATIWLDAFNDGCTPVTGEVRLVLDPFLTLDSSNPSPDTVIGDTLIWYVSNMYYDTPHFMAQVEVTVSAQAMLGDQICLDAEIIPDTNSGHNQNNIRNYCRTIITSYDPNDKQVSPQGVCADGFITKDETLTYTVRFQNTGNADAINIFILDTLDTDLDMSSLKIVGQSHKPMITEILPGRILKFRFDNIHLIDSTTNEAQSHGYVMFEVQSMANVASGSQIQNTAGIYFDFNEAVVTNTVLNTIVDEIPTQDTTFLQATSCDDYSLNGRSYTSSGIYLQKLAGTGSCDSVISLQLTIQPLDTSVSLVAKTLTSNEGGAHGLNVSYQWVDCNNGNAPISGATQQSFTPEIDGNYAVVISRGECSETSACYSVTAVGIDPDFQSELRYYPNPTNGSLQLELGTYYASTEIEISNAMGQVLDKQSFGQTDKVSLQLPDQKGLYFIQVKSEGRIAVVKILKK